MRVSTISLIVIFAFLMNGCLIDRIKQRRMLANQLKNRETKHIKRDNNLGQRLKRPTIYSPSREEVSIKPQTTRPVLYTPSTISEDEYTIEKKSKKVKKRKESHKTKKSKKVKKSVNRNKKRVKKATHEPYSIEKNEADPELLGPQTTLESNPLSKNDI